MKKNRLFLTTWMITIFSFMGMMNVSAQDFATGLVRLKSKRTSYYLSTAESGVATTTALNINSYDQVWILVASGSGYSLRSANTGEYLQATYTTPAAGKTTLYIRKSTNASSSQSFYNISSDSSFGGKFLNTNTSHNIFSYSMDDGCDWYIESVTNFTEDEVKSRLATITGFVSDLSEGKYYRVISIYGLAVIDSEELGGDVCTKEIDANNIAQYWTLIKDGNYWKLKNVLTQRYLLRQTTTSSPYHTNNQEDAANSFAVTQLSGNGWEYTWSIAFPGDASGLHDASGQSHKVVLWSTSAEASVWQFQECEVSQEAIDTARAQLAAFDEEIAKFKELEKKKTALQTALNALFSDKACTTLKDEIAALSDEDLATNSSYAALTDDMKAMVLKVKNNTWQKYTDGDYTADYERFFRIADYKVYSNYVYMCGDNGFKMSNNFGRLSGPTGIVANKGDVIYIYVDANPDSKCDLMLEAVSTDGVAGNHSTGEQTALKAGLNLFQFTEQKMLYILHQIKEETTGNIYTRLNRYSDIKVHIEGGALNGYWDATRGMTNADWKLLQTELLKASPFLNLKTNHLVFQMDADLVKAAEPNEMEGLMRVWDKIVENEERYMGVEDFEGKYNNVWNAFSGASSYMHASTYGTWYTESTISTIMNYNKMVNGGGNLWGPSHEIGHNHQASINVIGTTESSNNLFSNINTFESGILNSRRYYPHQNFEYMTTETPWLERDIWMTTGMFFQLYLYFHVQHHDDNFLPNLFRQMRKKPINKGTWDSSATYSYVLDGVTQNGTGAYVAQGSNDYLHLAKMICDVAQADLSEFFEAYGMYVPVNKEYVGDYSNYLVTTTQSEIDAAKAYMQKYEKKLGNIMFIDDRIIKKTAVADNIFGCVPASDGYKRANEEYPYLMSSATSSYVGGDYESFTEDAVPVTDDWYKLSATGKTITFQGTKNYAGHKFYDASGNLIWATNKRSVSLPQSVLDLGIENVTIMTANYDMTDTPCTNTKPIVITVTAENKSREYGEPNPTLTYTVSDSTYSSKPNISCSATATSPVGTYPIVISSADSLSNNTVTYINGTLTITKAPLTVSVKSVTREQGQMNPEFEITYSGFKNGETDSVLAKKPTVTCVADSTSRAGTYDIIVSGGEATNYALSYVNGILTVTEKAIDAFVTNDMAFKVTGHTTEKTVTYVQSPSAEQIIVPSSVSYSGQTYSVTAIADSAFAALPQLKSVKIPSSVKAAGKNLFVGSSHLAAITWEAPMKMTQEMAGSVANNPNLLFYATNTAYAPDGVTNIINSQTKQAERIVLSDAGDGNDFYCPEEFIASSISYIHTYQLFTVTGQCQGWESLVLPFDVTEITHETKGVITPFGALQIGHEFDNGTKPFWLYEYTTGGCFAEADGIKANVPYILSMPNEARFSDEYILAGNITFKGTNATVKATSGAKTVKSGNYSFTPSYQNGTSETVYLLNVEKNYDGNPKGSVFVKNNLLERQARPFEAYFQLSGSAGVKGYFGVFDQLTDEIRSIEPAKRNANAEYYQLDGTKRTSLQRGFNIVRTPDGKTQKVLAK